MEADTGAWNQIETKETAEQIYDNAKGEGKHGRGIYYRTGSVFVWNGYTL
jgi:hypothetical protein